MSDRKDGGAAFPGPSQTMGYTTARNDGMFGVLPTAVPVGPPDPGMSKRDWFAGKALVSGLVKPTHDLYDPLPVDGLTQEQKIAAKAYRIADAMLAASRQGASDE